MKIMSITFRTSAKSHCVIDVLAVRDISQVGYAIVQWVAVLVIQLKALRLWAEERSSNHVTNFKPSPLAVPIPQLNLVAAFFSQAVAKITNMFAQRSRTKGDVSANTAKGRCGVMDIEGNRFPLFQLQFSIGKGRLLNRHGLKPPFRLCLEPAMFNASTGSLIVPDPVF